jgi:hypothetical protein
MSLQGLLSLESQLSLTSHCPSFCFRFCLTSCEACLRRRLSTLPGSASPPVSRPATPTTARTLKQATSIRRSTSRKAFRRRRFVCFFSFSGSLHLHIQEVDHPTLAIDARSRSFARWAMMRSRRAGTPGWWSAEDRSVLLLLPDSISSLYKWLTFPLCQSVPPGHPAAQGQGDRPKGLGSRKRSASGRACCSSDLRAPSSCRFEKAVYDVFDRPLPNNQSGRLAAQLGPYRWLLL